MTTEIREELDLLTRRLKTAREAEEKLIGDDLLAALDNLSLQQLQKYIEKLERSWRATTALLLRAQAEERRAESDNAKRAAAESRRAAADARREKAEAHRRSEEMLQELLMPSEYVDKKTGAILPSAPYPYAAPGGNRAAAAR